MTGKPDTDPNDEHEHKTPEPEKKLETVEESWQSKLLKSNKEGFAELNSKLSKIESMLSEQIVVVDESEEPAPKAEPEKLEEPITPPPPKSRRESRQAKKQARRGK